jgi:hypothetical protein
VLRIGMMLKLDDPGTFENRSSTQIFHSPGRSSDSQITTSKLETV